jgi:phage shock protein PspC (stress-responsive transcriptional regulator)
MGRNFDPEHRRGRWFQRRFDRWNDRFDDVPSRLNRLRLSIRRSPNGLVLGVFRGIAERFGFSVCWTRIVGCVLLLALSGDNGHGSLLVAGFFYLLAAVLMGRPEDTLSRPDLPTDGRFDHDDRDVPPPYSTRAARRAVAAVPYQQVHRPRVDFAALDRQLEGLNRRIQRMEAIVTDRHYDWDRRMES